MSLSSAEWMRTRISSRGHRVLVIASAKGSRDQPPWPRGSRMGREAREFGPAEIISRARVTQQPSEESKSASAARVQGATVPRLAALPADRSRPPWLLGLKRLSRQELTSAIGMAAACLISYWVMTALLDKLVARDSDLIGGMWAAVAAAFVFRETPAQAVSAARLRFIATLVSFVLCLTYLLVAPPTAIGMAIILAAGAGVLQVLQRGDDTITMAITTCVVMVVAIMSPANAAAQPLLRLADTIAGMAVALVCSWVSGLLLTARLR
jgi:uncharacterized membrane protein YccC